MGRLHESALQHGAARVRIETDGRTTEKAQTDAEAAFAALRTDLKSAKPDVLIVVANDQFVNFFLEQHPNVFRDSS